MRVEADREDVRLPGSARPQKYRIDLVPDLVALRFDGTETVDLEVSEPTSELVLHSIELGVYDATLTTPDGTKLPGAIELDEPKQRLKLEFGQQLATGSGYKLDLRFSGTLNDQLHGFYRSAFTDVDGNQRTIAVTQFEPADARRAFPCWDEPDYKATFQVSLTIDEGSTGLCNTNVESVEDLDDGRQKLTFAESMVMSTYLVAFVIGPFELTTPKLVDGVPVRIAAVPGKANLTSFGETSAAHSLGFFSRYFGLEYPGDKIDHVAIPDFAFGAMENLGCVTYRESTLLVDQAKASQLDLQRVAEVVAHETAHMWFGDLVTMKWWNGIWLNEAFATFMELLACDDFRPEWDVWTRFGTSKAAALATDGLRHTRPVEFAVGPPEEAEAMFDVLTYQKGAAVLRMLEQYLGPDTFRKGIGHYLSIHAHGNTSTGDLWDALEAISGEPVRAMMDTWIFQGGYPLVSVALGPESNSVRLSQSRFLYDRTGEAGDAQPRDDGGTTWAVPISVRVSIAGEVQHQRVLLDSADATVNFDGPIEWIVVNDGASGFYRVRYSPELLDRLTAAGLGSICSPLERMGIVVDIWSDVVAGDAPLDKWVRVVRALGLEDDPDVLTAVSATLGLLDLVGDPDDRAALQAFVKDIASPLWNRLGWDSGPDDSERTGTARARVLGMLGLIGADHDVRSAAVSRWERFLSTKSGVDADLVEPVTRIVTAAGDEADWESVLDQYRSAATPQEKVRYLLALTFTTDEALLRHSLDLALSEEVRSQDSAFVITSVMSNRSGGGLAWDWVENHWAEIRTRLPTGLVSRAFDSITALVDRETSERVHRFVAEHEIPFAGPRLDQLVERMDINVGLAERLRGTIAASLAG